MYPSFVGGTGLVNGGFWWRLQLVPGCGFNMWDFSLATSFWRGGVEALMFLHLASFGCGCSSSQAVALIAGVPSRRVLRTGGIILVLVYPLHWYLLDVYLFHYKVFYKYYR